MNELLRLLGIKPHECTNMQHDGGRYWHCRGCGARYVDVGTGLARR